MPSRRRRNTDGKRRRAQKTAIPIRNGYKKLEKHAPGDHGENVWPELGLMWMVMGTRALIISSGVPPHAERQTSALLELSKER